MQTELQPGDMVLGRSYRLVRADFRAVRDQALTGVSGGTVEVDPDAWRVDLNANGASTNTFTLGAPAPPLPRQRMVVRLASKGSKGGAGDARLELAGGRAVVLESVGEAVELAWAVDAWHIRRVMRPGA